MKFLCGNCKAKYQIADEKASGRTLRMKCRRCGHDILIDGHTMPAAASAPPPAPSPTRARAQSVVPAPRPGSGVGPAPARPHAPPARGQPARSKPPVSLSQDFRRHIAAPPEVPQRTSPYDLWHVAIQDVPVGPMTRDELGRKIDAGAVTADSLCWREGMDDWRPLGELPEVSQLLRRPARPEPRSQRPPRPRVPPPVVPAPPRGSVFPPGDFEEVDDEGSEPTRIADITGGLPGIGPSITPQPQAAGSSTMPRAMSQAASQPLAAMAPMPGEVSVAVPMPRRERMSGSTGLALGLLVGILIVGGPILYRNLWVPAPQQPTAQAAALPAPAPEPKVNELLPADIEAEVPEAPEKPGDSKPRVGRTQKPNDGKAPAKNDGLTDAQRALIARMGGGEGGPNLSNTERETPKGGGGPALTAQQLTNVVQKNKMELQRCYESALRASGGRQDGAIKITVAVTVGESGTAKSVTTRGTGLGNMTDCMTKSVKRWRFPASGGESEFEFPLVFQPGA